MIDEMLQKGEVMEYDLKLAFTITAIAFSTIIAFGAIAIFSA
ncbi:cytochrome bd-I oxidase subunit CydH [Vibrio sp. 10N]